MQSNDYDENGHRVLLEDEGDGGAIMDMDRSPQGELRRAERILGPQFVEQVNFSFLFLFLAFFLFLAAPFSFGRTCS